MTHDDTVDLKITDGSFKWQRSLTSEERQAIHTKTFKKNQKSKSKTSEKLDNIANLDTVYIFSLRDITLTVKKVRDIDALVLIVDGYLNDVVLGGIYRSYRSCGMRKVYPTSSNIGGAYQGTGRSGDSGFR